VRPDERLLDQFLGDGATTGQPVRQRHERWIVLAVQRLEIGKGLRPSRRGPVDGFRFRNEPRLGGRHHRY
jgi:hypothetical protein